MPFASPREDPEENAKARKLEIAKREKAVCEESREA
jgi:hypothetical protein